MVACLDESRLLLLESLPLFDPERAALEEHIAACSRCHGLVAAFALSDDTIAEGSQPKDEPVGSDESPPPSNAPDGVPGYRLDHVLGEGSMGVVWSAVDSATGERVALKILKSVPSFTVKRAAREATIGERLNHPNVVTVHALLRTRAGTPALRMDQLEGQSLRDLMLQGFPRDLGDVVDTFLPICDALAAAHALGIVHRDLKPANVFRTHPDGIVKVLDFGLARLLDSTGSSVELETLTQSGTIIGTAQYMAPEQLFGERDISPAADVWTLGAMLYECLAGKRPLEGKSYGQLVRAASRGTIAELANLNQNVPDRLATIVMQMLRVPPNERCTLAAVRAALVSAR